jgi:hypothetical protein
LNSGCLPWNGSFYRDKKVVEGVFVRFRAPLQLDAVLATVKTNNTIKMYDADIQSMDAAIKEQVVGWHLK